jgi:hypothetical protein
MQAQQTVSEGDLVTLSGTSSFDPDGKIVSYTWELKIQTTNHQPLH